MNNAHERHPCPICVLQVFIEHGFDLGGTISAQIELKVHRSTRGRHDYWWRRLLNTRPSKALERADRLPGLERAKHHVGNITFDGDNLALLIEGNHAHSVPHRDRLSSLCRDRGFQFLAAESANSVRGLVDFAS